MLRPSKKEAVMRLRYFLYLAMSASMFLAPIVAQGAVQSPGQVVPSPAPTRATPTPQSPPTPKAPMPPYGR